MNESINFKQISTYQLIAKCSYRETISKYHGKLKLDLYIFVITKCHDGP